MTVVSANSNEIIRRKPRIVGFRKVFNKFKRFSSNYILPTVRYGKYYSIPSTIIIITITIIIITITIIIIIVIIIGIIPLAITISLNYSEPYPTLWELLNPFF